MPANAPRTTPTASLTSALERDELVAICEAAIVPEAHWYNRDTADAQRGVGLAWAWLRAGCEFIVHGPDGDPATTASTIWLTLHAEGFAYHDYGGDKDEELVYLPTRASLANADGKDWYGVVA